MGQRVQSLSSSRPGQPIEVVDRTDGKRRFVGCDHKSRITMIVRFWDLEGTVPITLPFSGPEDECISCRIPQLRHVEACSDCKLPRLELFNIPHDCARAQAAAPNAKAGKLIQFQQR